MWGLSYRGAPLHVVFSPFRACYIRDACSTENAALPAVCRSFGALWRNLSRMACSGILLGQHQIALHDKQGDDLLSLLVHELRHELMGMIDDLLRLVWMGGVVGQSLLQVAEVIFDSDVVIVGYQSALHEPRLARWARHHGDGIGRHHPLQVGGHIIAL